MISRKSYNLYNLDSPIIKEAALCLALS